MRRTPTKKAFIVAIVAMAMLGGTVATALAAPILPYGMTSYPGMSGTCTNCHTYAAPPATTPTPTPDPSTGTTATPTPTPTPTPAPVIKSGDDDEKAPAVHKKHHHHKRHKKHHRARHDD